MNKDELLKELSIKLATGEIADEEILRRLNLNTPRIEEPAIDKDKKHSNFSTTTILYIVGAVIVALGIVLFVAQLWGDIGSIGRIAVTLGMGFIFASIGSMLLKQKPDEHIGPVFHFIGGVLIPGGVFVTLSEIDLTNDWSVTISFVGILAFYLFLNFLHKHAMLTFFAIANGTILAYSFLNSVSGGPFEGWFGIRDIYQYLTMAIGASYVLLAYSFRGGWNRSLVGILNFFGSVGFLGAAYSQVFDSFFWKLFFFIIVLGGLLLSVYLKSRSVLAFSTIFLLAHVTYITSKYFADSLGWPISLVILGFIFIGLAYMSVVINKKYINSKQNQV